MLGVFSVAYNVNNENLLEVSLVYLTLCSSLAMTIKIWICKTFEMIKHWWDFTYYCSQIHKEENMLEIVT